MLPAANTVTLRAAANTSHAVVLSRANILEYWPSLRPRPARFSPANHDRICGGEHWAIDAFLDGWLDALLATPGLTGITDRAEARRVLLDDALRAAPLLAHAAGRVVDVGSGGGSPGLPLARAFPALEFTLLEAERRKCAFLERVSAEVPNIRVVWGRAEEHETETYGVALAKALAKPPVAAELSLPLVCPGGTAILWVGQSADRQQVDTVAQRLNATLEADLDGLLVLRKLGPTPPGFPRRPGIAKKRPLA